MKSPTFISTLGYAWAALVPLSLALDLNLDHNRYYDTHLVRIGLMGTNLDTPTGLSKSIRYAIIVFSRYLLILIKTLKTISITFTLLRLISE